MPTIKLTHNDINEMVSRAVRSIMNEAVKEVQGSIMAEKENAVQEIFDYVVNQWEEIKKNGTAPVQDGNYTFNNGKIKFTGRQRDYAIIVPHSITKKLGISDKFDVNVGVNDFEVPENMTSYFGEAERGTGGESYADPNNRKFIRTTMKVERGRIDLFVPSINGELQKKGFYSTLYHELNHSASRIEIQKKHQYLPDDEINDLHFFSATRRNSPDKQAHYMTGKAMHPEEQNPLALLFGGMFVKSEQDKKVDEKKRQMGLVFYAIWETTERNARAESIYGDLKAMNATRENFRQLYKDTQVYRNICEIQELLKELAEIPTYPLNYLSRVWMFAGKVMNMERRGKNVSPKTKATERYYEAVKNRFLKRSNELLEILYKKAMKVAELYFQRQEEREKDRPGGGIERLRNTLNTD